MFQQFARNTLSSDIGSNDTFTMDKSFHHRDNMSKFSTNIYHQWTLQTKQVSWQDWRLMHKQSIELILLEKSLN